MNPVLSLNEVVKFFTDTATLVVFDPEVIKEHMSSAIDWWSAPDLEEVKNGVISLVSLGDDGFYKIRITNESLTKDEKDFARVAVGPSGITTQSGHVFIGKGECLPGDNYMISPDSISASDGKYIKLMPGDYDLLFYSINADGYASEKKSKSLPDIVIVITKRESSFVALKEEPRIDSSVETFLYPSKTNARKLKPKLNKILHAKVWNTDRTASGKAIKEDGPGWPNQYRSFEIILEDMSKVDWRDRIIIKTTSFDEDNKIIYAELIEKLPKN